MIALLIFGNNDIKVFIFSNFKILHVKYWFDRTWSSATHKRKTKCIYIKCEVNIWRKVSIKQRWPDQKRPLYPRASVYYEHILDSVCSTRFEPRHWVAESAQCALQDSCCSNFRLISETYKFFLNFGSYYKITIFNQACRYAPYYN